MKILSIFINHVLWVLLIAKSMLINVDKIYCINDTNQKQNIYLNYLITKVCYYVWVLTGLRINNECFSVYKIIKIKMSKMYITRYIIFENKNLFEIINILTNKHIFDVNELLMCSNHVITEINLIDNKNNDYIKLKNILDNYADKSKIFDINLKNIFAIKNIKYNDNYKLEINYLHLFRNRKVWFNITNIINNHICDIYNLSV